MILRSLLFVPGDRPDRMEKALHAGADALILDLEDAVAPSAKAVAREATTKFLRAAPRHVKLLVRINPLDSAFLADDIAAVLESCPDGLVLPKATGAESVEALARRVEGIPILPITTETPAAIFQLGTYAAVGRQLLGLTWGAEDLPAAIGALGARDDDGRYTPPYELARSLTLFAGHAAEVAVIETVYPDFRDLDGLARYARRARRDGFTGMLAIHPAQISIINAAFTPTQNDLSDAQRIVDAFSANPNVGALQLDGRMIDTPHLKQARRILALREQSQKSEYDSSQSKNSEKQ